MLLAIAVVVLRTLGPSLRLYYIRRMVIIILRISLPVVTSSCMRLHARRITRGVTIRPLVQVPTTLGWVYMGPTHISLAVAATTLASHSRHCGGRASIPRLWLHGSAVV